MIDFIYRYDPDEHHKLRMPATAEEAIRELDEGNRLFAGLSLKQGEIVQCVVPFDPIGIDVEKKGDAPVQQPFAAVLGCADARVPTEMLFAQASNELFVVRVAGNVLGSECLGSLRYANHHFPTLKLVVVLGHRHCGAVKAAADAFIAPRYYLDLATDHSLRSIVDRIIVIVRSAAVGLDRAYGTEVRKNPGWPAALHELSIVLNAAWTSFSLQQEFQHHGGARPRVVFGIYDLASRRVRLTDPPVDVPGFEELARDFLQGEIIRGLLKL